MGKREFKKLNVRPAWVIGADPASPRSVVHRLRDGVSHHLGGLNEDEPRLALEEAEDVLANNLMLVRMALRQMEESDDPRDPE